MLASGNGCSSASHAAFEGLAVGHATADLVVGCLVRVAANGARVDQQVDDPPLHIGRGTGRQRSCCR